MMQNIIALRIFKSFLAIACIVLPFFAKSQTKILKAGAATVNITPSAPVPMSGYAARGTPSTGVHDEIFARAFVFDDGKKKACLIQADLIGFSFEFADQIAVEVEKKTGIPKDNCFLVAVHNHGAPSTRVYGETETDNLTAYLSDLQKKLVNVVIDAHNKSVPASLGIGKGRCTMNINRRASQGNGDIWLGRNPDGPCDHDVDVVRVSDARNGAIGLLINWPCHAVVGGQENSLITSDWPGATVRYLQKNFNAGIPMAITAGASGDINPIYGPGNNFGDMESIGLLLGDEIIRVVKDIDGKQGGTVTVLRREVEVPGKEKFETRMPGEKVVPGASVKLRFSVLKVGPVVFAGISGELMTTIGMKIKELSPFRNTTIVTHCNGSSGYLCTDEAYRQGGYEPMVSRTAPGVEKIIEDNLLAMLNEMSE
ncbi:MAG TPA: neutral/alkaline non-lysosomal ceramidase N-terminal domain-containing protein [Cyclobacteriaceae bacterium]|nr:neutral/alkaline non-lysosomal ceramidase N-terminal domain-containing protein [Cyclobacteriaceae bacterium]